MPALVPELANMASDPAVATTDLLRRALVVARRLAVPEFVDWTTLELNGYGDKEVPSYRKLMGNILPVPKPGESHAISRINPITLEKLIKTAAEVHISHGASVIEGMVAIKDQVFVEKFSPKFDHLLQQSNIGNFTFARTTSPIQYRGILDAIKNEILRWALDLEESNIIGEGMTFTQQEKIKVQQIHNHFGDVSGSQFQIGTNESNQTQANTTTGTGLEALKDLKDLVQALAEALADTTGDAADELRAELATLKAQAYSPKPKWEIIKATARSIKTATEGAAGNILAGLAQPYMANLLALAG